MKIAVDGMGGDRAPSIVVSGVAEALKELPDIEIILVGHEKKMAYYLDKYKLVNNKRLHLRNAEEVVYMNEPSITPLRNKKNSSIAVAANIVSKGQADALVSAGHTGATVASATVKIRTLPGIDRGAIATVMPAKEGCWILIDAGANTECKPINLAQFAVMGEAYSRFLFGLSKPKVGILSVGNEDEKGNDLTKESFKIISDTKINFAGNVEGHDVFNKVVDVVVCDGFVGNILLKGSESLAMATMHWMKTAFTKHISRKIGALIAAPAFKELKAIGDFEEYGGALLLGLKHPCIIGHGSSSPKAIKNAVKVASESVKFKINEQIINKTKENGLTLK